MNRANLSKSVEGTELDDSPATGKSDVEQINAKSREHERSSLSSKMLPRVDIVDEQDGLPPMQTALALQPRSTQMPSRQFPELEDGKIDCNPHAVVCMM